MGIKEITEIFKDRRINFIPILDDENKLINIITKRQFHVLLLGDKKIDLTNPDLINVDESKLDSEVYPRPWGFYKTLFLSDHTHVKTLVLYPMGKTSYQTHSKREEFWVVVKGEGIIKIDASERKIETGDYVFVPKECKHKITNPSKDENLVLIETQLGSYFGEDDIQRLEDEYGRI